MQILFMKPVLRSQDIATRTDPEMGVATGSRTDPEMGVVMDKSCK